ncbi:sulfide/dihydroorotate dehydrogenase-like FAD/NAD-binding protein [Enterococcus rivorum]|uniref:Dihydroorotate dehydrogenase n=1 Tax=Enterococcus rivorum TaxID=762845 RepID=A0A1E5KTI4_9ENTE|nr:sulfide/dihydroorotate dehydrogenase-like FAD/NAD-binding protein [Enterococcus rivorum]MBP2097950.1 ferredoxin--NADP+ reductase [Enterococcus rivorum]OEH81197.1 dihydroorotate dehydrogenase [Enterococcus rivorum]
MYKIVKTAKLSENQYDFWIEAPKIAAKTKPGQFIILRTNEEGERIPFTVVETDQDKGLIRFIFQVIGKSTSELALLKAGDSIKDVSGPLGMPTEIENYGTVMIVGGGVGIAVIYPVLRALKEAGNKVITILGAKTADLLILKDECQEYSDELIITTDDGSLGMKGLVTDAMENIIAKNSIDHCWAIGPGIMMKFCTMTAAKHDIPIFVSLNPIMIDGTGMCGCCRVTIDGEIKFVCVDGPEFKGTEVNWKEFLGRMKQYEEEEGVSLTDYQKVQVKDHG